MDGMRLRMWYLIGNLVLIFIFYLLFKYIYIYLLGIIDGGRER